MTTSDTLRYTRIHLAHGSGELPAVGFGTLIPDPLATKQATMAALEVGFRHLDCAERYRNEEAVGDAIQEAFKAGTLRREDLFVTTKLWNTNHRPERVKPAFDASRRRLQVDYVDCYLIHTPFAFQTRRRAGPEGRARSGNLRFRRHVSGDMASAGAPRGRRSLQGRSAYRTLLWRSCERSLRSRGSSLPSCRSNRIRISPNGTCSSSAGSKGSYCWRLRRWDMPWSQV